MTASELVAAIDSERQHANLSSAVRLFVLDFYRGQLGPLIGQNVVFGLPRTPAECYRSRRRSKS
jgi:predicted DNA-binding ribbon-helix-helix protein